MNALQNMAVAVNAVVRPLVLSPRWGRLLAGSMTVVTYTGRRSGRTFTIPVAYRREGDDVTIRVELPDRKKWWRNFTGEGAPLSVRLGGVERAGHGVASRAGRRAVVAVRLDPV
ncbi:nitroreductase family deazaflavin-dependent oxidoreductase [Pseudonocardia sp. KRD-184]|uniref:Nitroreductase family deazaflavin-dependent oxidoreductase n=1 Tax=Pseudonocardia oceani TaxID=2792013 RepID=A0ABS6UHR9_9PSEU|nr:nitroreductase/quinone reductase family protein [Pseudonocardia oceani]MBW0091645.1 nitroreductase family deazaflavin-dependent oxidoreductase [Pseudonocardia oceani]MBW0098802.1 nitroreductase family deazaflavin-dependent oxidoreductase [Pseudonocardia oceani]MBW0112201.1 nitroreductase family deazaflavin-dependent oxidoreductase [Pseudonocardia oceani]MBW0122277.1 nitroreductase family deazaflavin-dependent oxidoreductase [Pseudonocardia oceani]MBW0131785.1 nitroreductase family deazaflav